MRRRLVSIPTAIILLLALSPACSKQKPSPARSSASSEPEAPAEPPAIEPAVEAPVAKPAAVPIPFGHPRVSRESLVAPPLAAPAGAVAGPGGVRMQLLAAGSGELPGPTDTIIADYSMWTGDGKLAQSSYLEDRAAPFSVATLSPPLRSLLTTLKVGSKVRYWIPRAALEGWRPKEWPDSDLIIEVDLKNVTHVTFSDSNGKAVEPPTYAAPDASGPPSTATLTRAGLRFTLLVQSASGRHPNPGERLALDIEGYVIEGLVVTRIAHGLGTATTIERAPANLGEVLSQMKDGETARVWFPPKVGAQVIPDAGQRELVTDVKLTLPK